MSHTSALPLRTGQYHVPQEGKNQVRGKECETHHDQPSLPRQNKKSPKLQLCDCRARGEEGDLRGLRAVGGSLKETSTL
jgi:hypothetical protein